MGASLCDIYNNNDYFVNNNYIESPYNAVFFFRDQFSVVQECKGCCDELEVFFLLYFAVLELW